VPSQPSLAAATLLSTLPAPAWVSLSLGITPGEHWRSLGILAQDRRRELQIAGWFSEDERVGVSSYF